MAQNAIYRGDPYYIIETEGPDVELEPVEGTRDQRVRVSVEDVTFEPTDAQWFAALGWPEREPGGAPFEVVDVATGWVFGGIPTPLLIESRPPVEASYRDGIWRVVDRYTQPGDLRRRVRVTHR